MDTWFNVVLGLLFLGLGLANTLLMFHLWGYPYDHAAHRSSAPRALMLAHRATGYAFLLIYLYLMSEMLPRIWHYQIELPARIVMHLTLGLGIGTILIVKIAIVRFFKHLESTLIPALGTALLVFTALLVGLSVPFVFKEQYLSQQAFGTVLAPDNLARLRMLLPRAGFPPEADLDALTSVAGLQKGRAILLGKCVQCHDLRTALARPKPPDAWLQTVNRMADRAVIGKPIGREERWFVAAYLVAISPELQQAVAARREQELMNEQTQEAVRRLPADLSFDPALAKRTFEAKCVQCHALPKVEAKSVNEVRELVARMTGNGLTASGEELAQIVFHLSSGLAAGESAAASDAPAAPAAGGRGYRY
jgi:mono/diheme cytochrome c family protein